MSLLNMWNLGTLLEKSPSAIAQLQHYFWNCWRIEIRKLMSMKGLHIMWSNRTKSEWVLRCLVGTAKTDWIIVLSPSVTKVPQTYSNHQGHRFYSGYQASSKVLQWAYRSLDFKVIHFNFNFNLKIVLALLILVHQCDIHGWILCLTELRIS